ncbi:MAG: histidine kinase N-terminal 7TM domain-containing protein [Haloplanus sp.]
MDRLGEPPAWTYNKPYQAVDLAFGPGYYLHLAYTYVVTPTGFGLLALAVARSTLYRTQAGLLVVGALPPLVANAAFSLGVDWAMAAVDFTPFAFIVTGPCFGLALFRFDLLERVPVARKRIIADADDGFVVLDGDQRIVTTNPTAERILEEGASVRERFPDADADLDAVEGTTLTAVVDDQQRVYDVTRSTLSDHHDRTVGYVLRFRDITDRHAYEQRLKVANRVLRHDLRNRMNVITGWADELRRHDDEDVAAAGQQIETTAEDLIELGEQMRLLVETADANRTTESVGLGTNLDPLIERVRTAYPEATVEADLPSGIEVLVPDAKLLTIAVKNLLENAIEHNDADQPWVRVTVDPASPDDPYVRLHVADDGPAIPDAELEALRTGKETPLEHGSGLGLWLTHWIVTAAGGTISFDRNGPRGNVVTLAFRAAD